LCQQTQMMFNRPGDFDLVSGRLESGINLRHTFLEPERPDLIVMPEQQMRIFVINDIHVYKIRIGARQCQHDQVLVAAANEKTGEIGGFALIERQKWLHGFVIGKSHYDGGR
jgi:hypothetical protein